MKGDPMVVRSIVCAATFLLATSARAQFSSRDAGRPGERIQQTISYEVVTLPGSDSVQTRVDIFYRVDRAFFVPVRNRDAAIPSPFVRRGEISIDRTGKEGVPQGRSLHRVEIGESGPDPEVPGNRQWYTGAFSFEMPPGSYTFRFQVDDLESKRSFVEGPKKLDVPAFAGTSPADPLFIVPGPDSLTLVPANFGGDLLFGSGGALMIAWRSPHQGPVDVSYTFTVREPGGPGAVLLTDSLAHLQPRTGYALTVRGDSGRAEYHLVPDTASTLALLTVPFAAETLPLRSYLLSVWIREKAHLKEIPRPFRMVWPDMPLSLRDVDYALAALRHIASPSELDSLSTGGFEQQRDNLERYWKAKDPTPGTAFNEMMEQYYRRVDHAMRTYGSLKQPDGSRTDRGKIYILYGQPTNIDRVLDPSSGREVWTYARLRRKFTFIDVTKTGIYVLASTENL